MMTRIVKILFFLGVALLIVCFVAPSFIDWNKHKAEVMAQIEPYFQRKVTVAGNISFKGIVENVLAHENSLKNQRNVAVAQKIEDKQLYPDKTFTDTWCEKTGKENICLYYHGTGHTDGDAIIHFEQANIVHMGDLMFNRRHPFVDRSAGASMKNWIVALDKASNHFSNDTIFIYGHAGDGYEVTGTKDDLKAFAEYLGQVLNFVDGEIKAGKTKDEVLKTTTLPFDTQWKGDGLQRPLQAAYEELTAK